MKAHIGGFLRARTILLAICFVLLGKSISSSAEELVKTSESIYTLKVEAVFESGEKEILGLHSTGEASYLFLPAGVNSWRICNIDDGDKVSTEDGVLSFYNASSDTLEERPFVLMESANVGSVYVNTKGVGRTTLDSIRKEKYEAEIKIVDSRGYLNTDNSLEFIRTRGNGTFANTEKKPYEFKFEEKTSVLGMPKAKRWVLLANYFDNSLVRNSLIYDFAKKYTKLPSPNGRYVDLYIDGEYRGNYYLCEKVEIGNNRIEIIEQNKNEKVSEDISGGYLVCLLSEHLIEDGTIYFETPLGAMYEIKSPDNPTEEQIEYISGIFAELEDAVSSEDGVAKSTGRHYSDILDVGSYCDKYLVEQMFMNSDLNYNSQYYYKDADYIDPKLYAGPVWDYDLAVSDACQPQKFEDYYLSKDIFKFSEAKTLLQRKYEYVYKPYVLEQLEEDLKYKGELLKASYLMNRRKYIEDTNVFAYGYSSYDANAEYIATKLNERISYMDEFLYGEMSTATVDFWGTRKKVTVGSKIGSITAKIHNWFQIFNGWRDRKTGERLTEDTVVTEDIFAEPDYVDLSYLLTTPKEQIADDNLDLNNIDTSDMEKIEKVLERMKSE